MRRSLQALRAVLVFTLSCAAVLFAAALRSAPVFAGGEGYELYLGDSSSARIVSTDCPARDKFLLGAKGESVRYAGDRYEELKARFRAELLFREEACGVVNYYLHSPALGEGVLLGGHRVNLHIAVSEDRTAAGTPLIFGGF